MEPKHWWTCHMEFRWEPDGWQVTIEEMSAGVFEIPAGRSSGAAARVDRFDLSSDSRFP